MYISVNESKLDFLLRFYIIDGTYLFFIFPLFLCNIKKKK